MAAWIRVARGIKSDPKVFDLATTLKIPHEAVIGLLVNLWLELGDHAADGVLTEVADSVLESWALWRGKRGSFAVAYRRLFQDQDGRVHAWDRHNGRAIAKAERDVERVRQWREGQPPSQAITHNDTRSPPPTKRVTKRVTNAVRTRDVTGNGTVRTVRNDTEATPEEAHASSVAANWPHRAAALVTRHIGVVDEGECGRYLGPVVADHGEEATFRALESWCHKAPLTEKPQFLNLKAFARQAGVWIQRTTPIEVYDERGELSPAAAAILNDQH